MICPECQGNPHYFSMTPDFDRCLCTTCDGKLTTGEIMEVAINNLTKMSEEIFTSNRAVGWWSEEDLNSLARPMYDDGKTPIKYSKQGSQLIATKLCLVHSEVSEALEGMRKGSMDEHLKDQEMLGVELADVIIRVLDLAGALKIDIGSLVANKYAYNQQRADHKMENRMANGGKSI